MYSSDISRIMIAGAASGVGKTTITLAIMAALTESSLRVQGFKCGPDFIDPAYYELVTGRIGRNLDSWMIGPDASKACFVHAAQEADIAVVEGVMGLFDGKAGQDEGTTSGIAKLIGAPVILVIDCARMGASAAAIASGFVTYDPEISIVGFILNSIGSESHRRMTTDAIEKATGLPVLGAFPKNLDIKVPERHLGLMTSIEQAPDEHFIEALRDLARAHIDIATIQKIAAANCLDVTADPALYCRLFKDTADLMTSAGERHACTEVGRPRLRMGVARDEAFNFYYADNLDILRCKGVELVFFSPLRDQSLPPDLDALYLGGGYPEVHAKALSDNKRMRDEIQSFAYAGFTIYAECGGLLYLTDRVTGFDGEVYTMCGVFPANAVMSGRPVLGYREAVLAADAIISAAGERVRGHEFHYSRIEAAPVQPLYRIDNAAEGMVYKNTSASYMHIHFAAYPRVVERLIEHVELAQHR